MVCSRLLSGACLVALIVPPLLQRPVVAQQHFHTLGCGSGCSIEYFVLKGPYTGNDGLKKVLVSEVRTHGGGGGSPLIRKTKQAWIIADCSRGMLNWSSNSSNGRGSHADITSWTHISPEDYGGTNWDAGILQMYQKMCK